MTGPLDSRERNGSAHAATEAARADQAVAHGRAHLDYQRRIATAGVHRDNARMVRDPIGEAMALYAAMLAIHPHRHLHERKDTT